MNINGRLLLLLVVGGLFVRLWSVNDRSRHRLAGRPRTQIVQQIPAPVSRIAAPAPKTLAEPEIAAEEIAVEEIALEKEAPVVRPVSAAATEEHWSARGCPISLPGWLTPGVYRVVSDRGRVARLVVPADFESQSAAAAEVSIVSVDGTRWYFIRLQVEPVATNLVPQPADAVAPESEAAVVPEEAIEQAAEEDAAEPPLAVLGEAAPKFDFTGYDASAESAPVIEQAQRPLPPELPSPL